MARFFLIFAALNGFLSVAFGAFGAHALKASLSTQALATFQTGNQYHMAHSLALLALAALCGVEQKSTLLRYSGLSFLLGILLFSGSLYVLAITGIREFGIITPFGGLSLIVGWGMLVVYGLKNKTLVG